jgi:outer membrane protein assembly factor BamE (lipoprotein component of BamABCDE complex)
MKLRPLYLAAATVASLLVGFTVASGAETKNETPAAPSASAINPAAKRAATPLEEGMTAEDIQRIIGKPAEIKPIDSPEGKAETWTYRRVLDKQTTQEPVSTSSVPAFNGLPDKMGSAVTLEYRIKHTTTHQITTLLMFEGKLVKAKQWVTKTVSYDS